MAYTIPNFGSKPYFDDPNPTNRYDAAYAELKRATDEGWADMTGNVNLGSGSEITTRYAKYTDKVDRANTVGTREYILLNEQKRAMLDGMDRTGRYEVKPATDPKTGKPATKLYWKGVDAYGRPRNVVLAIGGKAGMKVRDFQDGAKGWGFGPDVVSSVLEAQYLDQFNALYESLTGRESVAKPTPGEQAAKDRVGRVADAWRVVKQGDPRKKGAQEK